MRLSQLFIQTLREAPGDARTPGYQYLIRAGYMRSLGGGLAWLPLGVRLRERVEAALRRALAAGGEQPVLLPLPGSLDAGDAGQPRERGQAAAEAGHEALLLALASGIIRSYRQLPVYVYESWQIPQDVERGAGGPLAARPGRLLDVYSLHADAAAQAEAYGQVHAAILGKLGSWGLAARDVISAEDGAATPIGHKVIWHWAAGEETFASCGHCGYAADQAVARVLAQVPAGEEPLPMQDVETPNCKTITELASFLGVPESRTAKAVFLVASGGRQAERFVFAVVRGDTALHEGKLKAALGVEQVGPATEAEIRQAGAEPGYGSPVGLSGVTVVVDTLAAGSPNLVAGANRPGYHTLNVNYGRDYQGTLVADIATAQAGSPCPACGSPLTMEQGVALAALEQSGPALSLGLNATYLDAAGRAQPLLLNSLRVYLDRLVAVQAERHNDEHGLAWPAELAPYQVYLLTLGKSGPELNGAAARIYDALGAAGISVLFDDREERAGVKFNDADLLGLPVRVAIGDRGLQAGTVEVKLRSAAEVEAVALESLGAHLKAMLAGG
jgi:prolyl-tRNA synthetase